MLQNVSVVICTIGRLSLWRAIESIPWDCPSIGEIIIVDDSRDGIDVSKINVHKIRLVRTEGLIGVTKSRILGVAQSRYSWIAFLDDDDVWFPKKIELQMYDVLKNNLDFSLTSALTFNLNQSNSRIRPDRPLKLGKSPFHELYTRPHFFYSPVFLPTSSFLLKRTLAQQILNLDTPDERENLSMLQEAFELGARISQIQDVCVGIYENRQSSLNRISASSEYQWFKMIESYSRTMAFNFAVESSRNFLRVGKLKELISFLQLALVRKR